MSGDQMTWENCLIGIEERGVGDQELLLDEAVGQLLLREARFSEKRS